MWGNGASVDRSGGFHAVVIVRKEDFGMACPKCGCKVTYCCNMDDVEEDYDMERCSVCGAVFYLMDSAEDEPEDYTDLDYENDCRINRGQG